MKRSDENIKPRKENLSAKIDFVKEEAIMSAETAKLAKKSEALTQKPAVSSFDNPSYNQNIN